MDDHYCLTIGHSRIFCFVALLLIFFLGILKIFFITLIFNFHSSNFFICMLLALCCFVSCSLLRNLYPLHFSSLYSFNLSDFSISYIFSCCFIQFHSAVSSYCFFSFILFPSWSFAIRILLFAKMKWIRDNCLISEHICIHY